MKKKWKFVLAGCLVILIIILLLISYPTFFVLKPFASGVSWGLPIDKICECKGIFYSYYPSYCEDCLTEFYCLGKLTNCKCLNITKAKILKQNPKNFGDFNEKYITPQRIIDEAYYECQKDQEVNISEWWGGPKICTPAGKSPDEYSFGKYIGPIPECCGGLNRIEVRVLENGNCVIPDDAGTICSDCGNNVCEEWENSCNCAEDCE